MPLVFGLWDRSKVDGPGDQVAASLMGFMFILLPISLLLIVITLVQTVRSWTEADGLSRAVGLACLPVHVVAFIVAVFH